MSSSNFYSLTILFIIAVNSLCLLKTFWVPDTAVSILLALWYYFSQKLYETSTICQKLLRIWFFCTCSLIPALAIISWMLIEDMRHLSQRPKTFITHSKSSCQSLSIFILVPWAPVPTGVMQGALAYPLGGMSCRRLGRIVEPGKHCFTAACKQSCSLS